MYSLYFISVPQPSDFEMCNVGMLSVNVVCINSSLFVLSIVSLYKYIKMCLSIHLWMDI